MGGTWARAGMRRNEPDGAGMSPKLNPLCQGAIKLIRFDPSERNGSAAAPGKATERAMSGQGLQTHARPGKGRKTLACASGHNISVDVVMGDTWAAHGDIY